MFCPNCGQEKLGQETTFCSRCGFLLTGTAALLATGGEFTPPASASEESPRKKGMKQGLFIFLLTFFVVPIVAILSMSINIGPELVAVASIVFFMGGLLRMAYALIMEEKGPTATTRLNQFGATGAQRALPPEQSIPASEYVYPGSGNWRDTSDLQPSVTENTTRLLEHEQPPPQ
jgi:hypothetical protein